jgi:hypothetical protein
VLNHTLTAGGPVNLQPTSNVFIADSGCRPDE